MSALSLSDDILIDVFRFSQRFQINLQFEFVNAQWCRCIGATEGAHFPLYKFYKIWICPLFCALHYKMAPTKDIILKEIFQSCSEICRESYIDYVTDDWPGQRIPFCLYIQKSRSDPMGLTKITFNYDNWRIERPENAHFFYHFKDICFEEAYLDVFNDRSLTLFLLDCPIFKLRSDHFSVRSSTESLPFLRITEFAQQKVHIPSLQKAKKASSSEGNNANEVEVGKGIKLEKLMEDEGHNQIFRFIMTGGQHCSEMMLEAEQFQMLFDIVDVYKSVSSLAWAIPVVKLAVPPYVWHQRPFVEGTICQLFDTSERLSPLLHQFAYFDGISNGQKFICNVHFNEDDEDKVNFYEFQVPIMEI